jgi:hypothetical protein
MAGAWVKKRVLIVVRTYPVPATKSIEASCTAGITAEGEWIRLFPIPYRLMDQEKRFSKWQWIEVSALRATNDPRPESYKLNVDTTEPGEMVGPQDGWRARRQLIEPLRRPSMCRIRAERDGRGYPPLGFFRPHRINRLIIEPTDANWSQGQLDTLRQSSLFDKAPAQTLEKIPFDFSYELRCGDADCKGHTMMCTDWEMAQSYRSWRRTYGNGWEAKFRQRYEAEMVEKNDTHFFVGTIHQHPGSSLGYFTHLNGRR